MTRSTMRLTLPVPTWVWHVLCCESGAYGTKLLQSWSRSMVEEERSPFRKAIYKLRGILFRREVKADSCFHLSSFVVYHLHHLTIGYSSAVSALAFIHL